MFSSLRRLKFFFVFLSIASVILSCLGGLHLFADTHYLSGTYSVVIIGYLAVILLPVVIIGLTIFLHCLEKELEIESCSVNRRITELDKKLESLK